MAQRKKSTHRSKQRPNPGYARFLRVALKLPGMEESISYGTPSLKVKGKLVSRLRIEAEGALAIYCDFIDREMFLQADPEVFFVTDHYRNYPMILIHLDKIRADALPGIVEQAWRMRAPRKLIDEFDGRLMKS
jgi:hypothetical protein